MADDEDLPMPFEIGLLVTGDIAPVFDKAQARSAGFTFYVRNPPEHLCSELQVTVDHHLQYVSLLPSDTSRQIRSSEQEVPAEPKSLSRQQRRLVNGTKSVHGPDFRSVPCVGSCGGLVEEDENLYSNTDSRQWAFFGFVGKEDEFELAESSMEFIRRKRGSVCAIVPFSVKGSTEGNGSGRSEIAKGEEDYAVTYFQNLMNTTRYAKRIYVALDIRSLPGAHLARLDHWLSEPVDCIMVPTSVFVKAEKTDPYTIDPFYRIVMDKIILLNRSSVLVCATKQDLHEGTLPKFVETLKRIYESRLPADRCRRIHNLFFTMQPLRDNLSQNDYKGFQGDRVKYQQYGEAMVAAFRDLRRKRSTPAAHQQIKFIVAVLGCGGGPLVDRAIDAAKTVGAKVRVYAVDKNPESIAMVRERCKVDWFNDDVIIQHADIRKWIPPDLELLDIVVHELLGNFADDECCPECLENVPQLLKEDGLSIPSRYTNFLTPISSTRLYGELKSGGKNRLFQQVQCFEAAKVAFLSLSQAEPVITFCHGPSESVTSDQSVWVDFVATTDGLLHGFTGHFEAALCGDVKLVTGLANRTKDLNSWSLLYFPISKPVRVQKDERISLHFRRRRGQRAVWYEWKLHEPSQQEVQNLDGQWQQFSLVFENPVEDDGVVKADTKKKVEAG